MADDSKVLHWRAVMAEQEASGESAAAFCRDRGIPAWKFHYWRKRIGAGDSELGRPAFLPVGVASGPVQTEMGAGVEVVFPSGAVLRADGGALRELVEALARC